MTGTTRGDPMLTLSLLRHAKSSWGDPALDDFDRPLAPRGERAAPLIGRWMAQRGLRPDHALVSPAVRAKETWTLVARALMVPVPTTFDERIYSAPPRLLLTLIRAAPITTGHLLVVGHNPGLHALATAMIGTGPSDQRARLDEKLPTAGLVVMSIASGRFADVVPGSARLVEFVTPRQLDQRAQG
jgi:phosphohistidine phosphatase